MKLLTLILLFLSLFFSTQSLLAQKHFNLIVKLPKAVNLEKLEVWLDNGKEDKKLTPKSLTEKQVVLAGDYYSMFAALSFQYTADAPKKGFGKVFFVAEKPATVMFASSPSTDSLFANYSLQNVLDFEKEKKQMNDYCAAERKKAQDYEAQYADKIFNSNDTAVRNPYFNVLMPSLGRKKLLYITKHLQSYFSFYTFRTVVARPNIASWDSLLVVFNSFPNTFKYSDEGNYLNGFLHGNLLRQKGSAIEFTAKDIHNKAVSLSQLEGKKYVLLHFWATWCSPCIRELPALKEISNQFNSRDLQIISIALPSKYETYLATIKKFQMSWIHVYNNRDLINKYGNSPTPRLCLIDKTGKLVYDNIAVGKNDNFPLQELKETLEKLIRD